MKRYAFALMMPLLAACGGGEQQSAVPASAVQTAAPAAASAAEPQVETKYQAGKKVYDANCKACHGTDGHGITPSIPPLAKSDYLKDKSAAIRAVAKGIRGKITVNGKEYDSIMPATPINDEEAAAVLSYVYNHFGNSGGEVTAAEVAKERAAE